MDGGHIFETLIAGFDGTDESADAVAMGAMLAGVAGGALVIVCVLDADARASAEELVHAAVSRVPRRIDAEVRLVEGRSAAKALHDVAEEEAADLLALGSSRRGRLGRVFPGSTAERLLDGAPCTLAVAPRGYAHTAVEIPRVIGVGFNLLPEARGALEYASALAEACAATLRVFSVLETAPLVPHAGVPVPHTDRHALEVSERRRLEHELHVALERLPRALRADGHVLAGIPHQVLAEEASKGVDALVLGSRGYGPVRRVLLGGTSAKLMRSAPCPVLAVPRAADGASGGG